MDPDTAQLFLIRTRIQENYKDPAGPDPQHWCWETRLRSYYRLDNECDCQVSQSKMESSFIGPDTPWNKPILAHNNLQRVANEDAFASCSLTERSETICWMKCYKNLIRRGFTAFVFVLFLWPCNFFLGTTTGLSMRASGNQMRGMVLDDLQVYSLALKG